MSDERYVYAYDSAGGPDLHDCCFLGLRYLRDHGLRSEWCESWVMRSSPPPAPGKQGINCNYSVGGWLTGLWRSPSNHLYATELNGRIHVCRDMSAMGTVTAWETVDFKNVAMQGVWGHDDNCIFVWCLIKTEPRVLFWNGSKWAELPPPPGKIVWMHGSAPDNVYAVGYRGLLARWDGHAWTKIPLTTTENFTGVFVAGADEMYAVGYGAALWEGTASGWGKVADGPGYLYGVAKFGGEVWVGAREHGLLKRVRNNLECVKPELRALMMDTRRVLLVTCDDQIASTADGKTFVTKAKGSFERIRGPKPPLFAEKEPAD
jgi:hypothetical protein